MMKRVVRMLLAVLLAGSLLWTAAGCSDQGNTNPTASQPSETGLGIHSVKTLLDAIAACDMTSEGGTRRIVELDFAVKQWVKDTPPLLDEVGSKTKGYLDALEEPEQQEFLTGFDVLVYADDMLYEMYFQEGYTFFGQHMGLATDGYTEEDVTLCNDVLYEIANVAEEIWPDRVDEMTEVVPSVGDKTAFGKLRFFELLQGIADIGKGSAGSSYCTELAAADLMQFTADVADCSIAEIQDGVTDCYGQLSVKSRLMLDMNLPSVLGTVDTLSAHPDELTALEKEVDMQKYSPRTLKLMTGILTELSGIDY